MDRGSQGPRRLRHRFKQNIAEIDGGAGLRQHTRFRGALAVGAGRSADQDHLAGQVELVAATSIQKPNVSRIARTQASSSPSSGTVSKVTIPS